SASAGWSTTWSAGLSGKTGRSTPCDCPTSSHRLWAARPWGSCPRLGRPETTPQQLEQPSPPGGGFCTREALRLIVTADGIGSAGIVPGDSRSIIGHITARLAQKTERHEVVPVHWPAAMVGIGGRTS